MRLVKGQVESVLKSKPETRNSDARLVSEIWKTYYGAVFPLTEERLIDLMRTAPLTTIIRYRAWFNQEPRKQYLPTDEKVLRHRKMLATKTRNALDYNVPELKVERVQPQQVFTQSKLI